MTNEQKLAVIEALKFYIKSVNDLVPDKNIELLEEVVEELESEVIPPPSDQGLIDDTE